HTISQILMYRAPRSGTDADEPRVEDIGLECRPRSPPDSPQCSCGEPAGRLSMDCHRARGTTTTHRGRGQAGASAEKFLGDVSTIRRGDTSRASHCSKWAAERHRRGDVPCWPRHLRPSIRRRSPPPAIARLERCHSRNHLGSSVAAVSHLATLLPRCGHRRRERERRTTLEGPGGYETRTTASTGTAAVPSYC